MNLRRKKKKILKMLAFLLVAGCILGFFIFIYPKASIPTYNETNSNNEEDIQIVTITSPNVNVTLPSTIKTISPSGEDTNNSTTNNSSESTENNESNNAESQNNNNSNNNNNNSGNNNNSSNNNNNINENINNATNSNKKYESYIDESISHLITILSSSHKLTILLTERSAQLIPEGSPTQVGVDYVIDNIPDDVIAVYNFTVDGYDYPIVLLLSDIGEIYYVDTEKGYQTGNFEVTGKVKGIPQINNIYTVTVDKNYKSAVLVDKLNVGYEFNLSMINK